MTSYRWDASDYANHSSAQFRWAQELIEKLKLQGTEDVLDIGCGDGRVSAEMARRLPHGSVLGIDESPDMVAFAKERIPDTPHSNLSFLQMDATRLDFHGRFDIVFSNAVMHWVSDHLSVLRGVKRALKPAGRLLMQMGGRGNASGLVKVFDEIIRRAPWRAHYQGFVFPFAFHGPEEYQRWLRSVGLTMLRAELLSKDMQHSGAKGFAGWIRTTWLPYVNRVPERQRSELIDAVVCRYLAEYPADADGIVHVQMVRLEVEATAAGR